MNQQQMFESMKTLLGDQIGEAELWYKSGLAVEINQLKQEKNAVILGHNYMDAFLFHSVSDFKGDSLELSRQAARTEKDIIVFCGVEFMAETAKILNPEKTVLIPARGAGCSLAESITGEDVRRLRQMYPGVPVVTYVNTYADVKAESDICCTSGNAVAVVQSLNTDRIIFLPDEFLAKNVARETGKHIIFPKIENGVSLPNDGVLDYQMIGWKGRCEVHEKFTVQDVKDVREMFPDVFILAHPECSPEVTAVVDFAGSTSAMIRVIQESNAGRYLLLTECAMADNVAAANPGKTMLRLCSVRCPYMNKITMENTLEALQKNQYEIHVPEDIGNRARQAVERMIAIG